MRFIETSSFRPWAVVLAGGEGVRLRSITRDQEGRHVPKQFCSFGRDGTLLMQALGHAAALTPTDHIVVVVQEVHRRWWEPALRNLPRNNVVVQDANRGTGVAVLCAMEHVLKRDRDPHFIFMPSDQGIDDALAWRRTLRRAAEGAVRWRAEIVLVGMEMPFDPDLGWLVPGPPSDDGTQPVLRFDEKPSRRDAARPRHSGELCSTFVFAASAEALLSLYARHAPDLVTDYGWGLRSLHDRASEGTSMLACPACDFSRELLERAPESLRVITGPACGWTDLGTPDRLEQWRVRRPDSVAGAGADAVMEPLAASVLSS